ncbi:MAG TPA: type III restriction endonuclease subunit R, partial [Deltaproteobacteria bacterium]|nr:type III restriction endonuclease subunit R [Deltaproteobacteria bacterium]
EPFGLINIGDDAAFFKLCDDATEFDNEGDEFGASLFGTLNEKDSRLHVLIGSRKFTEGWSSWRVSTMGLLNMGQGEGSQIIQLFGRGVRLKGKEYSLKRSTPGQRPKGLHLDKLETLNIFGVRASYMAQFKQYLQEEGVTTSDEIIELDFETRPSPHFPKDKLKSLALKDGYKDNQKNGFKRSHYPWLYEIPATFAGKIKMPHIELDLYPRLEALSSQDKGANSPATTVRQTGKIASATMAMFDFDRIFMAVQEYKLQRSWSNLRLDRKRLESFCLGANNWYTLHIPASELAIKAIADIRKQEDILIRLLQDYTDRFYKALKNAYEGQFYEVVNVRGDDDTMLKVYHFEIDDTDDGQEYKKRLEELQKLVVSGQLGQAGKWNANQMVAICFDRHLYYPLISIEGNVPLKMRPLAFDAPSEIEFVRDLEAFYTSPAGKTAIGNRSLYLLRNADTKAKGLGFAMAGNFYPDFLLWLVDDTTGQQWLNFIDPKGIRQINLTDPKFGLYQEVKVLQTKLADPKLVLNAFILSKTRFTDILNKNCTEQDLEDRHVLFMEHGGASYLTKMFGKMV